MMDELCVLFFGSHFVVLVVDMGNTMGLGYVDFICSRFGMQS